jgi:hypothetical protein
MPKRKPRKLPKMKWATAKRKLLRPVWPRKKSRLTAQRELLRPIIREACVAGLVEAIEHTHNFWQISDGYKKYINFQIKSESEALMAAVTVALRKELARHKRRKRPKP